MFKKLLIASLVINAFQVSLLSANSNMISQEQITEDVKVLADDNLAGRASFTAESDKAADYISQRFSQIGLVPLNGEKSFKQSFSLYQLENDKIDVKFDGNSIEPEKIILLTSHKNIEWDNKSQLNILEIKSTDNFRQKMQEFDQLSENLLVIVDESHATLFNRYQQYFSQPRNKLKINNGPSAVFILASPKNMSQFSITAQTKITTQTLTNLVGVLPGKKKSDELVLFSAHYDHLGQSTSDDENKLEDTIYNGADDDASGTSAIINLAEYFSKNQNNQRSLVFVAFAAEELGGFGSRYFSEKLNPEKISAMLNIEMIGKPSKFGAGELWMTGYERSNLADILNKNLAAKNKKIYADPYPEQKLFYRSDNATLARLGVPAHSFSSTQIDNDHFYHKTSDEFKTLDLESMSKVVQTIAESVETLIDGSDTPSRIDIQQVSAKGNFF